ncbi:unnamed protein product [Ilex paraguariensis]|uniref:Uncharacterized protein n=1 Tax=Ilex paraguariensis TaxID=185542 RepID=A0ABC8REH3_9AQUA
MEHKGKVGFKLNHVDSQCEDADAARVLNDNVEESEIDSDYDNAQGQSFECESFYDNEYEMDDHLLYENVICNSIEVYSEHCNEKEVKGNSKSATAQIIEASQCPPQSQATATKSQYRPKLLVSHLLILTFVHFGPMRLFRLYLFLMEPD